MSSEPIRQPLDGRLQPDRHAQASQLTEEQRNFAKVVGLALAEAWGANCDSLQQPSPHYRGDA